LFEMFTGSQSIGRSVHYSKELLIYGAWATSVA
jgi:hypothetical protein